MTMKTLRQRLLGAWKLVSYVEKPVDGSVPFQPMGENPEGIIMYTPRRLHVCAADAPWPSAVRVR